MPLYGTRDQKKWAAKRRAQLSLKHAFDRIDWTEDVIKPELEAMEKGTKVLETTGNNLVDALAALEEETGESA